MDVEAWWVVMGLTLSCAAFVHANPPESLPTDISLSQFLAIQEKGVSAWEFEPELEIANLSLIHI